MYRLIISFSFSVFMFRMYVHPLFTPGELWVPKAVIILDSLSVTDGKAHGSLLLLCPTFFLPSSPFHHRPNGYCNTFGQAQSRCPCLSVRGMTRELKTEMHPTERPSHGRQDGLHICASTYAVYSRTYSRSAANRVIRSVNRRAQKSTLTCPSLVYL